MKIKSTLLAATVTLAIATPSWGGGLLGGTTNNTNSAGAIAGAAAGAAAFAGGGRGGEGGVASALGVGGAGGIGQGGAGGLGGQGGLGGAGGLGGQGGSATSGGATLNNSIPDTQTHVLLGGAVVGGTNSHQTHNARSWNFAGVFAFQGVTPNKFGQGAILYSSGDPELRSLGKELMLQQGRKHLDRTKRSTSTGQTSIGGTPVVAVTPAKSSYASFIGN